MNLPAPVVNALRSYLEQLRDLQPDVKSAQEGIMAELAKGSERNLLNAIDPIIATGSKHMKIFYAFIALTDGEDLQPHQEQIAILTSAAASGDFDKLEGLPEDLRELMESNFKFNQALKESIDSKYGPEAMTRALHEDGLVEEFKARSIAHELR